MGKTAGCAACTSPGGKKHSASCLSRQEEWKARTIPQSERTTHGTQDTQAAASSSTVHAPMTDIRDINQRETNNDEFENPGEWTPAKRIRMKSRPLIQSKRPRETPTILEYLKVTSCREWEQATVQTRENVTSQRR